jgi:hypothetical protein
MLPFASIFFVCRKLAVGDMLIQILCRESSFLMSNLSRSCSPEALRHPPAAG